MTKHTDIIRASIQKTTDARHLKTGLTLDEIFARTDPAFDRAPALDLADHSATALDISRTIRYVSHALGEAHVEGDPMPVTVLPDLRQAQGDLAALIAALEKGNY